MDFGLTLKEEIFGKPCNLFLYKATVKLNFFFYSHTVEYPNHLVLKIMVLKYYGFSKNYVDSYKQNIGYMGY